MNKETLDWICDKNTTEEQSSTIDWVQSIISDKRMAEITENQKELHWGGNAPYVLPLAEVDTALQSEIKTNWFKHLCCLRKGELTEAQVTTFAKYLLSLQRDKNEHIKADGHWGLSDDLSGMPRDARVDFVYEPTILAVACLSFIKLEHKSIWEKLSDADNVLFKGIKFMYGRNLSSGGYSSVDGLTRATHILAIGKFWSLSKSVKDLNWTFLRSKLHLTQKSLRECIENPATDWSSREPEVFKQALNALEHDDDIDVVISWKKSWTPNV